MIKKLTIGNLTIGTYQSGFLLKSYGGFGMPSVRTEVKDRGHYHGANIGYAFYGRRGLTIDGMIIGTDEADFEAKRRQLAQNFDLMRGVQTLYIETRDGIVVQADVIVSDSVELPYEAGKMVMCNFQIALVGEKPFFESVFQNEVEVKIYEGGGFAIPFAIPLAMNAGDDTTKILENDGNGFVFPIITVYGSADNPTITNATTDETMNIQRVLGTNDYVVIDTYKRTAMLNGATNIMHQISGDWLTLVAGSNELRLTASGNDANTKLKVQWRDAYIGL